MLKLSYWKYKSTKMSMLHALMPNVSNMKEQVANASKEIKAVRKNQKEMAESQNTIIEIKDAFDGLINRHGQGKPQ